MNYCSEVRGERNAELTGLAIQIWTLDPEGLGGIRHAPAVMLEHGRDVVALEPEPRVAEVARRHERRRRAVELQRRQQFLDLNRVAVRLRGDTRERRAKLGQVARPGQRGEQRQRGLRERRAGAGPSAAERSSMIRATIAGTSSARSRSGGRSMSDAESRR